MAEAPAVKTWVLLNYPDARAKRLTKWNPRTKMRGSWTIVVTDGEGSWFARDIKLSGHQRHPTEYKAWKAAAIHMNKIKNKGE